MLLLQIDEHFNMTVLSSSRKDQSGMPDIGDSDPSVRVLLSQAGITFVFLLLAHPQHVAINVSTLKQVIYVRPGVEVDLDSVIQETIRLAASTKVK